MKLGFKRRFAPFIWNGTKTHTIRLKGNAPGRRVGATCHNYVDDRQPTMALLGRWLCTRIEDIVIQPPFPGSVDVNISIADVQLADSELDAFCWRDGFRPRGSTEQKPYGSYREFVNYWTAEAKKDKKRAYPFLGELIHWHFNPTLIGYMKLPELDKMGRAALPDMFEMWCDTEDCGWHGNGLPMSSGKFGCPNCEADLTIGCRIEEIST